jgi:hypothetical protein
MKRWTTGAAAVAVAAALSWGPAAGTASASGWRGEEVTVDGVLHVRNPESPPEAVRLTAKEIWRRGDADDDLLFGMVNELVADADGNVYVLDGQLSEIQVLSPDGEFLRTVGREGEGPGEFRNAAFMYLGPGDELGVLQMFPGKIVKLALDGTPAGEFPLPPAEGGGFQMAFVGRGLSDRVVLAGAQQSMADGALQQHSYLKAFDADGNEIAHFHDEVQEIRFGGMEFDEPTFSNYQRRWTLAEDGRVAAALDFDDYAIHVWKPDGSLDRVIERPDYEPLKRDQPSMERFQRLFDGITRFSPGSTFHVSETHNSVNQMWFRDDGSLWVLASRGAWAPAEGLFAEIDVYDRTGRWVRRVQLALDGDPVEDGLFFVGDRAYLVTDLFSAVMSNLGGGDTVDDAGEEEPEPVQVIAYELAE